MSIFKRREERQAAARWRANNARAKAAGCKCGKPATHVRRYGGTIGGVPSEVWTCEEHQDVHSWTKRPGDPHWTPAKTSDTFGLAVEEWRVG